MVTHWAITYRCVACALLKVVFLRRVEELKCSHTVCLDVGPNLSSRRSIKVSFGIHILIDGVIS